MCDDKVVCKTPADGKTGTTSIPKWKYDCLRTAIINSLGDNGLAFKDLPGAVKAQLSEAQLSKLGSVGWHVTTVKLNMEVDGEIERVSGQTPQYLRRKS